MINLLYFRLPRTSSNSMIGYFNNKRPDKESINLIQTDILTNYKKIIENGNLWNALKLINNETINNRKFKIKKIEKKYKNKNINYNNLLNNFIKFSIIRNPYDRVVSLWRLNDFFPPKRFQMKKIQIEKEKPFKDFVYDLYSGEYNKRNFDKWHSEPYSTYILDDNDNNILDFTIRYENLKDDLKSFCKYLNIEYYDCYPHVAKSDRKKDYRQYYDDDLKNKVYEIYKKDIDNFKYEF